MPLSVWGVVTHHACPVRAFSATTDGEVGSRTPSTTVVAWVTGPAPPVRSGALALAWSLPPAGLASVFGVPSDSAPDTHGYRGGGRAPAAVSTMNPRRLRWTDGCECLEGLRAGTSDPLPSAPSLMNVSWTWGEGGANRRTAQAGSSHSATIPGGPPARWAVGTGSSRTSWPGRAATGETGPWPCWDWVSPPWDVPAI